MAAAPTAQNFIRGWPSAEMLETEQLRSSLVRSFQKGIERSGSSLNYGDDKNGTHMLGHPDFLKALAGWLSQQYGFTVEWKHLMTVCGSSMGLDTVARQMCKAGDLAVVEEPTYFLSFTMLRDRGMDLLGVPMQDDGMDLDALEEHCIKQEGKVKLVYTVPVHHNPTGITMSEAKRQRLVQLAQKYKFYIAADEAYALLNFDESAKTKPLFCYDDPADPRVYSIGTFSKLIGPGVKVGWVHAHEPLLKPLTGVGWIDSGNNPVTFSSVNLIDFLESGAMTAHLEMVSKKCGEKCAFLCKKLRDIGLEPFEPKGGYFVWVKSKGKMTGRSGEVTCINKDRFHDYMRLCFAWLSMEQIDEGIEFLRD